jgi:NAD(P)-dependent dehydrogenase (short-subunit alcohol dehydrogenase family)
MPTLFITGANRGIGLALTQQYLEADWQVVATCRNPDNADELNQLAADFDSLSIKPLEVTQASAIDSLVTSLDGRPVDILINNAGVYGQSNSYFGNTNTEQWLDALNTNTIAPIKIMEALVDNIAASEKRIIASMSSKMGSMDDNGSGGSYVYRSTKAALNAVMVSAAHDLKPRGITTVILHPGWVRTDMGGPNGEISTAESAAHLRNILAKVSLENAGDFYDIDGSIIPW